MRAVAFSLGCVASSVPAQAQDKLQPDTRDLGALLLFNGEPGARAYDTAGPIGDSDAIWSRQGIDQYTFVTARSGVTLRGAKVVDVEPGCAVTVATRFMWLFAAKPSETLERVEEFDFRLPVVADAVLALKDDKPDAVILDLKSGDGFYCVATRINGAEVSPRRCSSAVKLVVGPGREDSPVLDRFRRFSESCKRMGDRR